jgi:hypothetical protein
MYYFQKIATTMVLQMRLTMAMITMEMKVIQNMMVLPALRLIRSRIKDDTEMLDVVLVEVMLEELVLVLQRHRQQS